MRIAHLTVTAAAALVTFVAGSSAISFAQPRRAPPSTAPLFALSERDLSATSESGCECTFDTGRPTLLRAIGHELTIRTRAGRQACRITDAQFGQISGDRASVACAGLRLSLRRTGRVHSDMGSDSATWPATLTISQGRSQRTLNGRMGCAC